jgi:threonine aldolase
VDALSFGGTKQGMLCGEAVVFLKPGLCPDYPYYQKHAMQLSSKMRFIAAQFEALLEDDLWIENGRLAVAAARRLLAAVQDLPFVQLAFPTEANAVFARIPVAMMEPLMRESFFWPWDEQEGLVRWMCAFDSQPEDVDRFVALLKAEGAK